MSDASIIAVYPDQTSRDEALGNAFLETFKSVSSKSGNLKMPGRTKVVIGRALRQKKFLAALTNTHIIGTCLSADITITNSRSTALKLHLSLLSEGKKENDVTDIDDDMDNSDEGSNSSSGEEEEEDDDPSTSEKFSDVKENEREEGEIVEKEEEEKGEEEIVVVDDDEYKREEIELLQYLSDIWNGRDDANNNTST